MSRNETMVEVFKSKHGFCHVIVSLSKLNNTYVVAIEENNKAPLFIGVTHVDIFDNHISAKEYVMKKFSSRSVALGLGLVGYTCVDKRGLICIVKSCKNVAKFNGHDVNLIKEIEYIDVSSNVKEKTEKIRVEKFELVDYHYYSETYDLTRPFPSKHSVDDPDTDFLWNNGWIEPFKVLGIDHLCIKLIQGHASSYHVPDPDTSILFFVRRSSANCGTRFLSRGINEDNHPANEAEGEVILCKAGRFEAYKWRRGSVPIKWVSKSTGGIVSNIISHEFSEGTREYFVKLAKRYNTSNIKVLNLLSDDKYNGEGELCSEYEKSINIVKEVVPGLEYYWYDLAQARKEEYTYFTRDFMHKLSTIGVLKNHATCGMMPDAVEIEAKNVVRINCLDSLDRTNLGSFLFALSVVNDWCIRNNICINPNPSEIPPIVISNELMYFLIKSFLDSGNVISMQYTHTKALNYYFKKYYPSLDLPKNAILSSQRFIENSVNDPTRNLVLKLFTKPPSVNWVHRIPPNLLRVLPPFSQGIVELTNSTFSIPSNSEIYILLPCRMYIFSILLLLLPLDTEAPRDVEVSIGDNIEKLIFLSKITLPRIYSIQWSRYRIGAPERYGLDIKEMNYGRILKLKYIGDSERLIIGNVKVECSSNFRCEPIDVGYEPVDADSESVSRYKHQFKTYLSSGRELLDAYELEKNRVFLSIPCSVRAEISVQNEHSPWDSDSCSRFILNGNSKCILCLQKIDKNQSYCVYQSKRHPGLLVAKSSLGTNEIYCCKNCRQKVHALCSIGESALSNITKKDFPPQPSSLKTIVKINHGDIYDISSGYQCHILNESEQNISLFTGKSKTIFDEKLHIYLAFIQPVGVKELHFISNNNDLDLDIESRSYDKRVEENRVMFSLHDFLDCVCLTFNVLCKHAEIDKLIIYGRASSFEYGDQQLDMKRSIVESVPPKINLIHSSYSKELRIDTLTIKNTAPIKLAIESRKALSFIICFYKSNGIVHKRHFILPEVGYGTVLTYNINKSFSFDRIRVFYLDRVAELDPVIINILKE